MPKLLSDGEAAGDAFGEYPGGSAANTIYALARLGLSTAFFGTVGDDPEGKVLLRSFNRAGADTSHISIKEGASTGQTLAISDREGNRALYVFPGANDLLSDIDVDASSLAAARLVHTSSFLGKDQLALQRRLLAELPRATLVSLAPGSIYCALGWEPLAPMLSRADVLFLNAAELQMLTGTPPLAGIERCLDACAGTVAVTLGAGLPLEEAAPLTRGTKLNVTWVCCRRKKENERRLVALVARDGDCWLVEGSVRPAATPLEGTGAGDAFAAGFLFGLLQGAPPGECGALGHTLAGFAVGEPGARAGLPRRRALLARGKALYGPSIASFQ